MVALQILLDVRTALNAMHGHQPRYSIHAGGLAFIGEVFLHTGRADRAPAVHMHLTDPGEQTLVIHRARARQPLQIGLLVAIGVGLLALLAIPAVFYV